MSIKYNNYKNMVNYMSSEFETESDITIISSLSTIEEILDNCEFDYKNLTKTIKNDNYFTYSLEKYTCENGAIYLTVEALEFDSEDGLLENDIDSTVVIFEEGLLDEADIEMIYFEELECVDFEDDSDLEDDFNSDNGCQCETCQEARENELEKSMSISKQETNSDNCLHDCRFCNCCEDEEEYENETNEEEYDLSEDCLGRCSECDGCDDNEEECETEITEEELNEFFQNICTKTVETGTSIGKSIKSIFVRFVEQEMEEKLEEFEELVKENENNEEFCLHCSILKLLTDTYLEAHTSGVEYGKNSMIEELENLLNRVTE